MTTAPAFAAQLNGKAWHNQSAEDVLTQLGSAATGLSATEAARRLAANGPNELKEGAPISPIQLFLAQFKSLIIWILIAAALISGLLGERIDALAILTIAILNAVIGFYQEFKAEKSIAALKQMTSPHATVRRDGQVTSMPASGVVTGDILALAEIFRVLKPGGELYSADFGKLHTALMACVSLVVRWLEEAY